MSQKFSGEADTPAGKAKSLEKSRLFAVPETGLEPALPLQEPGPQPGASANSATPAYSALILRSDRFTTFHCAGSTILRGSDYRGEAKKAHSATRGRITSAHFQHCTIRALVFQGPFFCFFGALVSGTNWVRTGPHRCT